MAYRVDTGSLRPPRRLSDGSLRVDGYLTRTGVFAYRNADGSIRREYRPPDEVFHQDSLESFAMRAVTDDHPSEPVTPANARAYAVGWTGENVRKDDDKVAAPLLIADAETIAKVEAGKVELSCGYEVEVENTPGQLPDGTRYDAVQRKIRGNHVALVDVGRAGPEARLRMDAAAMVRADSAAQEGSQMELEKQLAAALQKAAEAEARANQEKQRADSLEEERDALKKERSSLVADRDKEKVRADKAEAAREDAAKVAPEAVAARVQLERKAGEILGERNDGDKPIEKMTDRELKVAIVEKVDGTKIAEEWRDDDVYVTARYDSAVERADKSEESIAQVRGAAENPGRQDEGSAEAARQKMIEANRNAWKPEAK